MNLVDLVIVRDDSQQMQCCDGGIAAAAVSGKHLNGGLHSCRVNLTVAEIGVLNGAVDQAIAPVRGEPERFWRRWQRSVWKVGITAEHVFGRWLIRCARSPGCGARLRTVGTQGAFYRTEGGLHLLVKYFDPSYAIFELAHSVVELRIATTSYDISCRSGTAYLLGELLLPALQLLHPLFEFFRLTFGAILHNVLCWRRHSSPPRLQSAAGGHLIGAVGQPRQTCGSSNRDVAGSDGFFRVGDSVE